MLLIVILLLISSRAIAIENKWCPSLEETAALKNGILKCEVTEKNLESCEQVLLNHKHEPESMWKSTEFYIASSVVAFIFGVSLGSSNDF